MCVCLSIYFFFCLIWKISLGGYVCKELELHFMLNFFAKNLYYFAFKVSNWRFFFPFFFLPKVEKIQYLLIEQAYIYIVSGSSFGTGRPSKMVRISWLWLYTLSIYPSVHNKLVWTFSRDGRYLSSSVT